MQHGKSGPGRLLRDPMALKAVWMQQGHIVPPLSSYCITERLVFICTAQKAFHTDLLPSSEPAFLSVPGFTLHRLCFTQEGRRKLSYTRAVFACLSHLDCKLFMGLSMFMYREEDVTI